MPITFKLSSTNRSSHFAEIEMTVDNIDSDELIFELPSWRPGRYELGNFAKNIRSWKAFDGKGQKLAYKKVSKDTWKVSTEGSSNVIIRYEYYCGQPDAGGCWIDEHQVYINPVHCFLFLPERLHEAINVELYLPGEFRIASSLQTKGKTIIASDFHELYDSPFIASNTLQHQQYSVNNTNFNIWFQGACQPDWKKIISDFKAFTEVQLNQMKDFPFKEYHFLIQILPYPFYHGVEHLKSTVLALGPGENLMDEASYENLTGVASHELFHSWNIKTIRPAEMHPYNYKKENYSRLGYVYEGVTTYYGDLFLVRSKVYSVNQFFKEIGVRIQKHFDNPGRLNLSVADSSFDTWLDGYTQGVPGRKTSIYDEGCLTSLMTDLLIRKHTNSKSSLDDVMRTLYADFGKKNRGYSEHDYLSIVENIAGKPMSDFFLDFVYGTEDYENFLGDLLTMAGCELRKNASSSHSENHFGFRTEIIEKKTMVKTIAPNSPAFKANLGIHDEIVAVNENKVEENIDALLSLYEGQKNVLTVFTQMRELKDLAITPAEGFFPRYYIVKNEKANKECREFFTKWLNREFVESQELETKKSN